MSADMSHDDVGEAGRPAVANDPKSVPLRLHLAELLLGRGDAAGALAEVAAVMATDAGNDAARELLARASIALNGPAVDGVDAGLADVVRLHAVPATAADASPWDADRPGITLADVGGMEKVKARLR